MNATLTSHENAIYFSNPHNIRYLTDYAAQHWSTTKKIQILKVRAGFSSVSIKDKNSLNKKFEAAPVVEDEVVVEENKSSSIRINKNNNNGATIK